MSTQIAVRLPDELVKFIDATVASGNASSRAAVVASAVEHELRLHIAARDARILSGCSDPDLDSLAAYAARVPLDLD